LCPGSATSGGRSKTKFSIGKSLSPPTVAPVAGVAGLIVSVASVVPDALSTAICSGLPVPRGPAHPLSHGHQVTRNHLRRIGARSARGVVGTNFKLIPVIYSIHWRNQVSFVIQTKIHLAVWMTEAGLMRWLELMGDNDPADVRLLAETDHASACEQHSAGTVVQRRYRRRGFNASAGRCAGLRNIAAESCRRLRGCTVIQP
jgi:hypothetical protein